VLRKIRDFSHREGNWGFSRTFGCQAIIGIFPVSILAMLEPEVGFMG